MNLNELIKYQKERDKETFEEAKMKAEANHWNAVANRLFNLRQEGDYLDFKRLNKDTVYPNIEEVNLFITELDKLF